MFTVKTKHEYRRLYNRIPLNVKMVFITIVVGLVAWALLDYIQTHRIRKIFFDQLNEKLVEHAREDRLSFDNYIKSYNDIVRIYVTQNIFADYVENQKWSAEDNIGIKFYRRPPKWFPKRSVLKTFALPRYALMLDSHGNTREVYLARHEPPPTALIEPTRLLIEKSLNKSFMTKLDNIPYLLTAESYLSPSGNVLATLILASPIDNEFLITSLGKFTLDHLVALLTPGKDSLILTSSNPEKLAAGASIKTLQNRYLVTGKEFFDQGASELQIKFATFVSKAKVDLLIKSVISRARQDRAISAFTFILTFTFIMYLITQRIQKITGRIKNFSQQTLGIKPQELQKGDQLQNLEESFQRLTDEIKISQAQLIQSEKLSAMGQLSAGLAHELNSPLAGLFPLLEKYRDSAEEGSKEHTHMTLMFDACKHMAKVIRDFGSFSRDPKGEYAELDIEEVIEDTLSFGSGQLIKKGIQLIRDYANGLPKVRGDKTELQQVVLNMISNACDAMPDGSEFVIKTGFSKDKNKVIMEYSDSGIGIEKENLDRIFDPFFTTKEVGKGVGLGLSVSYGIIKNHEGEITVDSEYGKGTRFRIFLPALRSQ
jgi:signal transduction histidine kinase